MCYNGAQVAARIPRFALLRRHNNKYDESCSRNIKKQRGIFYSVSSLYRAEYVVLLLSFFS